MKRERGTGTIVERNGKYLARWRVNGRDLYSRAFDTRDEAEFERLKNAPDPGSFVKKREIPTFVLFARACLDRDNELCGGYGRGLKSSTHSTHVTHLEKHIAPSVFGAKRLDLIEKKDIQLWLEKIPCSASYKRRCHAFVSRIFNLAVDHGFLRKNPAKGVKLPAVTNRNNTRLTDEQLAEIKGQTSRTADMVVVSCDLGLRRSELINLRWVDVFEEHVQVRNGKNFDQVDRVCLTDDAKLRILRQPRLGEYVFGTKDGHKLGTRNLNRDIRTLFDQLGIPKEVRLHDSRGKFVTDLIKAGVDIKTVQDMARHTNPETTLKYYARSSEEDQKAALTKMQELRGAVSRGTQPQS